MRYSSETQFDAIVSSPKMNLKVEGRVMLSSSFKRHCLSASTDKTRLAR